MSAITGLVSLITVLLLCQSITVETGPSNISRRFLLRTEPCHCNHDCTCQQGRCVNNQCDCVTGWAGTDCGIQSLYVTTHKPVATTTAVLGTHHDCSHRGHFSGTHCECFYGYSGDRCQHGPGTRHECSDPSCDHGICQWWLDNYGNRHQECYCDAEYVGDHCTYTNHPDGRNYLCMDQTLCEHGYCVHNTKYDVYQYYACICEDGWHGKHCDENHSDNETIFCDGKVCRHGTCQRENNEQRSHCKCDIGWNGQHCDIEVTHHCGNQLSCLHGLCLFSHKNGYDYNHRCDCIDGWYGVSCDRHISAETVQPCNGRPCRMGTCIHASTGDICLCDNGWTGTECDTVSNTAIPTTSTPQTTATTTTSSTMKTTATTTPSTTKPSTTTNVPQTTTTSTTKPPSSATTVPQTTTVPVTTVMSTTPSPTTTSSTRIVFTATSAPHPIVTSACDKTSVSADLVNASHVESPFANQCSSGLHQSSEALVLSHCQVHLDPSVWKQGDNVVALCNSSSPPLAYTPIATFENGVYSSTGGRSGVFLWCNKDGFKMAFQTCTNPAHMGNYVDGGAFIQDPTLYYIIQ